MQFVAGIEYRFCSRVLPTLDRVAAATAFRVRTTGQRDMRQRRKVANCRYRSHWRFVPESGSQ